MGASPERVACESCAKLRDRIAELELALERFQGVPGKGDAYALTRLSWAKTVRQPKLDAEGLYLDEGEVRRVVFEPGDVVPPEVLADLQRGVHYEVR